MELVQVCISLVSVGAANPSQYVRSGVPRIQGVTSEPAKILKYVNERNEDGSYTYGFKSSDGTYKSETRTLTGEVRGTFGYINPDGRLRESSYGNLNILKIREKADKRHQMRTNTSMETENKTDENSAYEEEKEWKDFGTTFTPVRKLIRTSEDTLKRQIKLVLFPLQKIVQREEELPAVTDRDQHVLESIKKVIEDEEEIITQRQDYVVKPLNKLQGDLDNYKNISKTQNLRIMRDRRGMFMKTLENISRIEEDIVEKEESLILAPLREIIKQEEEVGEPEYEDQNKKLSRRLVLISIVVDQEDILYQVRSLFLLPLRAILREAASSGISTDTNSSMLFTTEIPSTTNSASSKFEALEMLSTIILSVTTDKSSTTINTPLPNISFIASTETESVISLNITTLSPSLNTTSLSPTVFMTNSTNITVLVLSVLLILSILCFMLYMIKQQYDSHFKGRTYRIADQVKKIKIPRARLTAEPTQKNLKCLDDFDDDLL